MSLFNTSTSTFERHLEAQLRREEQSRELWAMSAAERVAAMRRQELSLVQLCEWSRRRPDEVPKIGAEFEWVVYSTADWLEQPQGRLRDLEESHR